MVRNTECLRMDCSVVHRPVSELIGVRIAD